MKYVLAVALILGASALLFTSIRDFIKRLKARRLTKKQKEKFYHECERAYDSVDAEEVGGSQSVPDQTDEAKDS